MNNKKSFTNRRDPHKVFCHMDRLKEWRDTGTTFPITIDIDITTACNNKCPGCRNRYYNLMKDEFPHLPHVWGYAPLRDNKDNTPFVPTIMSLDDVKSCIKQFADLGGKAVALAGSGEPSSNPDFRKILYYTRECGLDVSVSTNGNVLSDSIIRAMVECCTWINVSLDAHNAELYKLVHGVDEEHFDNMLKNIHSLVARKREVNSDVTIGTSYLIGHYTVSGTYEATALAANLRVDYMRLRPYWSTPQDRFSQREVRGYIAETERCTKLAKDNFEVSYPAERFEWMIDRGKIRNYEVCNAIHFSTTLSVDKKIYPCCHLRGNPKYVMGDLNECSFEEASNSNLKKNALRSIDFSDCPAPCGREHELNKVLWELRILNKPVVDFNILEDKIIHKNFI